MYTVPAILILVAMCGLASFFVIKALRQGMIPTYPQKDKPYRFQFVHKSTNPAQYLFTIIYGTVISLMSFTCFIILLYRALVKHR